MNQESFPPELLQNYEVQSLIGSGGQAKTWYGVRYSDQLPVVIKSLHVQQIESWKALELFEREAQVLAQLDLAGVPHFVDYYASPNHPTNPSFHLVQAYVHGQNLQEMMDGGEHFSYEDVINISWQVAQILEALHAYKPPIIHRDIKPSNIILNEQGEVSLIDFGAVADAFRREGGSTVVGTFGYMPPEQYQGRAIPRSDLYALGVTMLHMLSNVHPSQMGTQHLRLDYEEFVQLPYSWTNLINRLIEPEYEHRLSDAKQLRIALENLAQEDPSSYDYGEEEGEGGIVPVQRVKDIYALGQPGTREIFRALPAAPRKIEGVYRAPFRKKFFMFLGISIVAFLFAVTGVLSLFGFGPLILAVALIFPFVFPIIVIYGRHRYLKILKRGLKARARISKVRRNMQGYIVEYEFKTKDGNVLGKNLIQKADIWLETGDEIGVLYREDKPQESLLYPLPPICLPNALDTEDF